MKVGHTIVIGFAAVTLLITAVVYTSIGASRNELQRAAGQQSMALATHVMHRVDSHMYGRVEYFQEFARDRLVRQTTAESNREFSRRANAEDLIQAEDARWIATAPRTVTPFMQQLIDHPLSEALRTKIKYYEDKHGYAVFAEVFVTNRYGANVALTGKTSDYYQADETWWQRAREDGLSVTDVQFDESAGVYSTNVCIRIVDQSGEFLGVMKVVLNVKQAIDIVKHQESENTHFALLTKDAKVIHATGGHRVLDDAPPNVKKYLRHAGMLPVSDLDSAANRASHFVIEENDDAADNVVACVRSTGHADFPGLGWILVMESETQWMFASLTRLQWKVASMLLVAVASVIGLSWIITKSISNPIQKLRHAAAKIGQGHLTTRVDIKDAGELSALGEAFNAMAARLAETTTSIKHLNKEIAERNIAEHALREAKDYTASILSSMIDLLIVVSPDGTIATVNRATCKLLGYEESELIGQPIQLLLKDEEKTSADADHQDELMFLSPLPVKGAVLRALFRDGHVSDVEGAYVTKNGREVPVSFSGSVMRNPAGRIEGIVCVAQDVTERRRLLLELAQAHKLESVGQLAAGIAHEINTPTQFVSDNVRFLKDAFDDIRIALEKLEQFFEAVRAEKVDTSLIVETEQALQHADMEYLTNEIPRAIDQSLVGMGHVASIVRAMRDFSHPGTQEKIAADLNDALETTITVARNEWKYTADMTIDLDPELPHVPCLIGELNQVFLNLIVNAAHAVADRLNGDATRKGVISIATNRDGDWAQISVSDTGVGIPEDIRERVFDPFFTTKEVGRGTGQGLAIARSVVVDKHGGTIYCESEEGRGTTFFVRLPLRPEPHPSEVSYASANS